MDGYVRIGTELDTKDFSAEIKYIESQLEEIEHKLKQADMGFEVGDTEKLEAQYSKLIKQLDKLIKKQNDLNKTDLTEIEKNIDKIGNSVNKTVSKVGKWALAVFGVRNAYMFIRQSASTLAQYNDQISDDLEYIQFALASTLQPVIETLINLVYKLLVYINYIAQAWFGIDLFANASAKAMEKGSKSAEKMKKSLAGFDEMNVLNDNKTARGADAITPSVDLSAPKDVEVPEWIKWIAENGKLVATIIEWITLAIAGLVAGLPGLIIAGIILQIIRVIDFIKKLIEFIKDPSWDNFYELLQSFIKVIFGPLGNAINWVLDKIKENWDKIKEVLISAWEKIREIFSPVIDFFSELFGTAFENVKIAIDNLKQIFSFLWEKIKEIFKPVTDFFKEKFEKAFKTIKEIFEPIVSFFSNLWEKVKTKLKDFGEKAGEVIGGAFKTVINGVLKAIENILNSPIKAINKLMDKINKVPGINLTKLTTFNLPRLAVGGIVNMPGRGVPVGGAIAGEVSKEGVIPLTDAQAMQELGQTIGRYITINANITNTMNGRVISREMKKINANNDFATNS